MRILRIADISDNRTGGMSRTMYCTGDELQRMGHEVEYWFENRIRSRTVPIQFRRFIIPWRIVLELERELLRGKAYDIVEIHEPISARYAWQRQRLPPLVIFSYGLEERSHEAMLGYRRLKGLPVSTKMRFSPLSVVWQAAYSVRRAAHVICSNSEDVNHLRNAGQRHGN